MGTPTAGPGEIVMIVRRMGDLVAVTEMNGKIARVVEVHNVMSSICTIMDNRATFSKRATTTRMLPPSDGTTQKSFPRHHQSVQVRFKSDAWSRIFFCLLF